MFKFILMITVIPLLSPGEKGVAEPLQMEQVEPSLDDCLDAARKVLEVDPADIGMKVVGATCSRAPDDQQPDAPKVDG